MKPSIFFSRTQTAVTHVHVDAPASTYVPVVFLGWGPRILVWAASGSNSLCGSVWACTLRARVCVSGGDDNPNDNKAQSLT